MSGIPPEIIDHYGSLYEERVRLTDPLGIVEWLRTLEILDRVLPDTPQRILDVGGGPGRYAHHLAGRGHEVHLIDPVRRHVDQALEGPLASAVVGDAADLGHPDGWFDAVLMLGPLYHLPDRIDRMDALGEARRVLRPGGVLVAAGVSRFASVLDGLDRGFIDDPRFRDIMAGDLDTGRHLNPTGNPEYFTTGYFHHPEELAGELSDAGFGEVEVLAVESIAWVATDLDQRVNDAAARRILTDLLRRLEREPSLLGASPHLLALGRRPTPAEI